MLGSAESYLQAGSVDVLGQPVPSSRGDQQQLIGVDLRREEGAGARPMQAHLVPGSPLYAERPEIRSLGRQGPCELAVLGVAWERSRSSGPQYTGPGRVTFVVSVGTGSPRCKGVISGAKEPLAGVSGRSGEECDFCRRDGGWGPGREGLLGPDRPGDVGAVASSSQSVAALAGPQRWWLPRS